MAERDSNDTARAERDAAARLDATAPPDLDLAGKLTPARPRSDTKAAEPPAPEAPQATAAEENAAAKPEAEGPQETEKAQGESAQEPASGPGSAQEPASGPGPDLREPREPRLSAAREPVRLDHLSTAPSPGRPPRRSSAARPSPPLRSDYARGADWPPDPADPERRRRAVMWRMGALAAVIVIAGAATIAFQLGSLYEPPQRVAVSGMASLAALPEMPAESDASQRMSVVNKSRASQNQQAAAGAPPPTSDVAPQGSAGTVPLPTGQVELPPAVRPGEPATTPADEPARSAEAAAAPSDETVNAADEIAAIIEETAPATGEETAPAPAAGEETALEPVEATGSIGDVQPASDETAASGEMPTITAASSDGGSQADAEPAQVTTDVNMRSGPANEAAPIAVIPRGSEVTVWGCDYWCEVSFGGRRGYVYRDFVQPRGA